jgi:hypothetical protein
MNVVNDPPKIESHTRLPDSPIAATSAASARKRDGAQAEATGAPSSVVQISMESLRLTRQEAVAPAREETGNEALERYSQYEHRLNRFMRNFFTQGDKELLGKAYRLAEEKEVDLKKIDKLANELGAWRIRQYMAGDLVLAVVDLDENEPRPVDLAHMAILGEMRKMAG